jgi:hypothetical protein
MSSVLSLYRNIFKAHKKKLPEDMRKLGDEFVKNEWKLHKNADPMFTKQFVAGWSK